MYQELLEVDWIGLDNEGEGRDRSTRVQLVRQLRSLCSSAPLLRSYCRWMLRALRLFSNHRIPGK